MSSKREAIEDILGQKRLAVVGVSRRAGGFGWKTLVMLRSRGYEVTAVNPNVDSIGGDPVARGLLALPSPVDAAILVTPKRATAEVVGEAARAKIHRLWIQPESGTDEALALAQAEGMTVVAGECIFMYASPRGMHRFHRWVAGMTGNLPK